MCGINGIIGVKEKVQAEAIVVSMNNAMQHRGPDDHGIFVAEGIALGHRRLSIIDLSSAGHQPMFSSDNACVIAYNGEIYNFLSLKSQLGDYPFRTHTDTEVILAAYQKWGLGFIEKLDGMFAIALFDLRSYKFYLFRDRLGVKPLYYSVNGSGEILFASEIRSLMASGRVKRKLDENTLPDYLTFQATVDEDTLIAGVKMLPAGSFATIEGRNLRIQNYWKISSEISDTGYYDTAKEKTRDLFFKAVEKRLISDVPLGVFLSGGIDSSAVVAAMSAYKTDISTFNINFSEKLFSEAEYAELVAKKYNTNHTCINLQSEDFLSLLPSALGSMDVPSWDGINTYVVSKAVKEAGLSVALSGIGGDEWFGGYPVFRRLNKSVFSKLDMIPQPLRKAAAAMAVKMKPDYTREKQFELLSGKIDIRNSYYAIRKLYTQRQISTLLKHPGGFYSEFYPASSHYSDISVAEWRNYLMPVLLRDTDQMSMSHALEIREPFLDYKLIEYVLTLPDEFKNGKTTKSLLVDAMGDLLPHEVVHRPKMGFVLPWKEWLKTDLKPVVDEGLEQLCNHPSFIGASIEKLRSDYFNDRNNIRWNMILNLVVLGFWMKKNKIEY